MSSDMRDYLEGNAPRTPEQQRSREDTLAHARNKTTAVEFEDACGFRMMPLGNTDPDANVKVYQHGDRRIFCVDLPPGVDAVKFMDETKKSFAEKQGCKSLKASDLMTDHEVLTEVTGCDEADVKEMVEKLKRQKIDDLKMQIIAQNPYCGAAGIPLPPEKAECCKKETSDVMSYDKASKAAINMAERAFDRQIVRGLMVFYFDVGNLAPEKAEAHIAKWKDRINEKGFLERLKAQSVESLFIPVRQQETRVEYIEL